MKLQGKPSTGDRVSWEGGVSGTVTRCYESICWFLPDGKDKESCFIWKHPEGLNNQVRIGQ